jgi:hypothetical protein
MVKRSIEVRKVEGLQALLDTTIFLGNPPFTPPSQDAYTLAVGAARQFLTAAVNLIGDGKTAVFAIAKWPADGLAQYGILVALNPRFKIDPFTGLTYFAREFIDSEHGTDRLTVWKEADEQLVAYCTAQFGKPKLVK